MKLLSTLVVLLIVTGCVQETGNRRSGSSSESPQFSTIDTGFSPTENTQPADDVTENDNSDSGLIVPTDSDPVDESTSNEPVICGQLYRSSANYHMIIDENDGSYHVVIPNGYSAESILDSVSFPNDSYTACVYGELNGSSDHWYYLNHVYVTNIQLQTASVHPQRESLHEQYSYAYCGTVKYYTSYSGTTNLEIWFGTMAYILDDQTGSLGSIVNSYGGEVEGCVYGDSAPTRNTSVTFKRYFDVEMYSVGWE